MLSQHDVRRSVVLHGTGSRSPEPMRSGEISPGSNAGPEDFLYSLGAWESTAEIDVEIWRARTWAKIEKVLGERGVKIRAGTLFERVLAVDTARLHQIGFVTEPV